MTPGLGLTINQSNLCLVHGRKILGIDNQSIKSLSSAWTKDPFWHRRRRGLQ